MQIDRSRTQRFRASLPLFLTALVMSVLSGCSTPPTAPVVNNVAQPFAQASATAIDGLFQTPTQTSNPFGASKRTVVLDPTLDAASGQQTNATLQLDRLIAERVKLGFPQVELLPFEAANLGKAPYVMTGTLTRATGGYRVNLALVDLKAANVVAQSSSLARPEGVDMNPLAYYRDSPVLVKDKVVDGYVRTSATAPGLKADADYLGRIATAAVINDATQLYNAARYREALGSYRSALAMPSGEQIRVLNGIYLSLVKLGQTAEAEEAFGRLVNYGLANNNLSVKFLFNPGSTDFWADTRVTSAYGMWLRQIARQATVAKVCMDVLGHTSSTGTEAVNDALSLRRAQYIKRRLSTESAELGNRLRTEGMGSKKNIVGTGTDDVVDAPDRRVEFQIGTCAG